MNLFSYTSAAEPREAIAGVAGHPRAKFLAGGTTLVDLMKLRVETPDRLVDINALPLATIEPTPDGGLRIGALVRNSDLASDPAVRKRYPALSEALLSGASPQLRNMATVGGNLMQRTRCSYFRDADQACNKLRPGSGCAALDGYHRAHAVLGATDRCIAAHPSDMAVALAALDAVVQTRRPDGGGRTIALTDFHLGYGEDPARESVLQHGELIVAVELPALPWLARSVYVKVRDRASYEFALASAAVALDLEAAGDGGRIRAARVALGGVGTKPWRSFEAERTLAGERADEAAFRAAAEAAMKDARPRRDNAFKVELAKRVLVRALHAAAAREM